MSELELKHEHFSALLEDAESAYASLCQTGSGTEVYKIAHAAVIGAWQAARLQQAKRIAELEAQQQSYDAMIDLLKEQHAIDRERLADSNEALQVMGLKLAQAEGHSANIGLRTRGGERILMLPGANILIVGSGSCELVSIYSGSHTRYLNCFEESFVLAALDYSANTVGVPTPGAAPAWQSMDTAPTDGREFLIRYPLQGNVKQLACWNNIHKYWQSKGEPITPMQQKCEWYPLP